MDKQPFYLKLGNTPLEFHPDRTEITMFREEPDKDYIDILHEPETDDPDEPETHTWIFSNRELLLWMGRICVQWDDEKTLRTAERTHGTFKEAAGWLPPVRVVDTATEWETELYTQSLLNDLNGTYYVPPEFEGEDDDIRAERPEES